MMCIICNEWRKSNMNIQDIVKAGMELIYSGQITEEHLEEIIEEVENSGTTEGEGK